MENVIHANIHGDPFTSSNEVNTNFNASVQYMNCVSEAAEFVLNRLGVDKIDIAIVEGSGLADLADYLIPEPILIDLAEIPHCPIPTALGHK